MSLPASATHKRRFKDTLYTQLARIPAALANPHRLELLELLEQSPRSVQDVAVEAGLSVANASQHLRLLAECGLVETERRGTFVYYRQTSSAVHRLVVALREVTEAHDPGFDEALRPYLRDRDEAVSDPEALRSLLASRDVALLDARPPYEYAAGHLPGAVNAPIAALKAGRVGLLPTKRYLVYCRGPYCTFADEAVTLLRARGFTATRVEVSPADWAAAGGQVEHD